MKRLLTFFILFNIAFVTFANTRIGADFVYTDDAYNIDNGMHFGFRQMLAGELDVELYNIYVDNKSKLLVAKDYIDIENRFDFNIYSPAFFNLALESNAECLWTHQSAGNSSIYYADIGLSASYFNFINSWLTLGAKGYIGYVPVAMTNLSYGSWNDGNSLSTKITVWMLLWSYIKVYAGMESIERFGFPTMEPVSLRNTIGAEAHVYIKDTKLLAGVDYYCQHPEMAWKGENTSQVNRARLICKIGVSFTK